MFSNLAEYKWHYYRFIHHVTVRTIVEKLNLSEVLDRETAEDTGTQNGIVKISEEPNKEKNLNLNENAKSKVILKLPTIKTSKCLKQGKWYCPFEKCGNHRYTEMSLEHHYNQHFQAELFRSLKVDKECPYCKTILRGSQQKFDHIMLCHAERTPTEWILFEPTDYGYPEARQFICKNCGFETDKEDEYQNHLIHDEIKAKRQINGNDILLRIPNIKHNVKLDFKMKHWLCFYRGCGEVFKRYENARSHYFNHFMDQFFEKLPFSGTCQYCSVTIFDDEKGFFNHILSMHADRKEDEWAIFKPSSKLNTKMQSPPMIIPMAIL